MNLSEQKRAYQRGAFTARYWKRLKTKIRHWDSICVSVARRHNLPTWLGHIPIISLVTFSLVCCLTGGLLLAAVVLIVWAILLLSSAIELLRPTFNVGVTDRDEKSHNHNYGSNGSNGSDGSTGS